MSRRRKTHTHTDRHTYTLLVVYIKRPLRVGSGRAGPRQQMNVSTTQPKRGRPARPLCFYLIECLISKVDDCATREEASENCQQQQYRSWILLL